MALFTHAAKPFRALVFDAILKFHLITMLAWQVSACARHKKSDSSADPNPPHAVSSELLPLNFPARDFELTDNIAVARLPKEQLSIERDPFFREPKKYVALKTKDLLLNKVPELSGLKKTQLDELVVTFINLDRKRLILSVNTLLSETAYLAVQESLDRNLQTSDRSKLWSLLPGTPYPQTLGPAYLVLLRDPVDELLEKSPAKPFSFPRIVKVIVSQRRKELGRIEPNEPEQRLGFELFLRNCATCHTLHYIGSRKELELVNAKPAWQGAPSEAAAKFLNPLSAAHSQAQVLDASTDLNNTTILTKIFGYLDATRSKKICTTEAECNALDHELSKD